MEAPQIRTDEEIARKMQEEELEHSRMRLSRLQLQHGKVQLSPMPDAAQEYLESSMPDTQRKLYSAEDTVDESREEANPWWQLAWTQSGWSTAPTPADDEAAQELLGAERKPGADQHLRKLEKKKRVQRALKHRLDDIQAQQQRFAVDNATAMDFLRRAGIRVVFREEFADFNERAIELAKKEIEACLQHIKDDLTDEMRQRMATLDAEIARDTKFAQASVAPKDTKASNK